MVGLTRVALFDSGYQYLDGVSDLETHVIGSQTYLFAAGQTASGLTSFRLNAETEASFVSDLAYAGFRGTLGVNHLSMLTVDGQATLVPSGQFDNRLAMHRIDQNGAFDGTQYLGASETFIGGLAFTQTLQISGRTFMIGAQYGESGFRSYEIRDNLTLSHKRHFEDTSANHVDDITGLASGELLGRTYFFAISGFDDGITSYWMGRYGNVKERDSKSPSDGLWVDAPSAVETVELGGKLFVIVGAAGSGTLTALKVNAYGGLFVRDHELDDANTRFDGVAAIDTLTVNGHAFVFAGGADDGISVFRLTLDGRLHHVLSLADEGDTTLQNVSAIKAVQAGSDIQLFVSGSEPGITQFDLDISDLGLAISGNNADNTLNGGGLADTLVGMDGADALNGGGGDDFLVDGAGADVLTGGAGADTFVFVADKRLDSVLDFNAGQDRIDLTDLTLLHQFDQLSLTQKNYGVLVEFGSERLRLEAESGVLQIADLSAEDFIL